MLLVGAQQCQQDRPPTCPAPPGPVHRPAPRPAMRPNQDASNRITTLAHRCPAPNPCGAWGSCRKFLPHDPWPRCHRSTQTTLGRTSTQNCVDVSPILGRRSLSPQLPDGYKRNFASIQIDVDFGQNRVRKWRRHPAPSLTPLKFHPRFDSLTPQPALAEPLRALGTSVNWPEQSGLRGSTKAFLLKVESK